MAMFLMAACGLLAFVGGILAVVSWNLGMLLGAVALLGLGALVLGAAFSRDHRQYLLLSLGAVALGCAVMGGWLVIEQSGQRPALLRPPSPRD